MRYYIHEKFIFNGETYGVLKDKKDETFSMFVKITKQNAKQTDWISISETMESVVKNHYKRLKKNQHS